MKRYEYLIQQRPLFKIFWQVTEEVLKHEKEMEVELDKEGVLTVLKEIYTFLLGEYKEGHNDEIEAKGRKLKKELASLKGVEYEG